MSIDLHQVFGVATISSFLQSSLEHKLANNESAVLFATDYILLQIKNLNYLQAFYFAIVHSRGQQHETSHQCAAEQSYARRTSKLK
jgi:urease accessory protein UreF